MPCGHVRSVGLDPGHHHSGVERQRQRLKRPECRRLLEDGLETLDLLDAVAWDEAMAVQTTCR